MLRIRLARAGRRNRPIYRIVVADARSKRDGKNIDVIGTFDPIGHGGRKGRKIDCRKYNYWLSKGAQPSDRVRRLCAVCTTIDPRIRLLVEFLRGAKRKNSYSSIISEINRPQPNLHYVFEALFIYQLSRLGIEPEYEKNFSAGNEKSVDFTTDEDGVEACFELLRLDDSDTIQALKVPDDEGFFSVGLSSSAAEPHLRPAAQDIRMQEKLCDKVEKYIKDDSKLAILVVDCSTFHLGTMDVDDMRSVMTGAPKMKMFTQSLDGERRVKGLLELDCPTERSAEFRERISAVIFVPSLDVDYLKKATIAVNSNRSDEHKNLLLSHIKANPTFRDMKLLDY